MKIVYEGALFPGVGGGPRHFTGISQALARAGVDLTVVLPRGTPAGPVDSRVERVQLWFVGGRAARQLTYEICRIVLILRWWLTGRRFDVWMSRQSLFGIGTRLTRLVARHSVVEINGPVREEIEAVFGSSGVAAVADWLMRVQVRAAHLVVVVTPGLASYIGARVPGSRCEVVANGADRFVPSPSAVAESKLELVFAGAVTPWYELDVVLDAIKLLGDAGRHVALIILGDGVGLAGLRVQAHRLGLDDRVTFAGWVDSAAVARAIQRARVGVLPLKAKHPRVEAVGSPLKLYEYVAAGLRVVGTEVDGVANAPVRAGVHVFRCGDVTGCAAAICEALDAAPALAPQEDTWSWDARARQLMDLVESLD